MRFTIERDAFAAAVKRASGAIMSRTNIPILECVHIKAEDNTARITGTNLDEWVAVRCDAAVTDAGAACVSAALLSAWLQASPKRALVNVSIINGELAAVAGRATATFSTLPADQYPTPEKSDKGEEVPARLDALAACLPFASNEETRHYLNGVAISEGHFVATDGHRLCAVDVSVPRDIAAIIPTRGVQQIVQFSEGARLWIGASYWRCEGENVVAGGKLIDGTFPEWTRVIPADGATGSTDADAMLSAVRQAMIVSGEKSKAVAIKADADQIEVQCRGPIGTASGAAAYEGEAFQVGMNGKYAETALSVFSGNVVDVLAQTGGQSVMLFTCKAKPDTRVVVMGMRI